MERACRWSIEPPMSANLRLIAWALLFTAAIPACCQSNNTSSLSCWENKKAGTFQTRRAKSPVFTSSSGSAYVEVTAEASSDSGQAQFCKNKAQLFYTKDGSNYRMVYEKPGLDDQGVGMRVLGWSHKGTQLLMELSVWGYDSDAYIAKSALVLESGTSQVRELPLDDAFQHFFGKDCEFDFSVVGWEVNDTVLLRVTKTAPTTHYQQTFCVLKPTVYAFDQQTGRIGLGKDLATSEGSAKSNAEPR
jgi:hypothetical protein